MEIFFLQSCYDGQLKELEQLQVTGGSAAQIQEVKGKLAKIRVEYKQLTGGDIAASDPADLSKVEVNVIEPEGPAPPPSSVLILDLYPTGSSGMGLPVRVMKRLQELIDKRDPSDSGFDIPCPDGVVVPPHQTVRVKLGVRATVRSAIMYQKPGTGEWVADDNSAMRKPFWMPPRSSLSKTPLILHNSIGVIDAGYNGELQAAVHNTSDKPCAIEALTRLVQVVSGDLTPFYEVRLHGPKDRPAETRRGEGGFGSTGKQ